MHTGDRVDADLLGVLLAVLDVFQYRVTCDTGLEHFVLGLLTTSDAPFNKVSRGGLDHFGTFVARQRRRKNTVGGDHLLDVTEKGFFHLLPVTGAHLFEGHHLGVFDGQLAFTGYRTLDKVHADIHRLSSHLVQVGSILNNVALGDIQIANIFVRFENKRVLHCSTPNPSSHRSVASKNTTTAKKR